MSNLTALKIVVNRSQSIEAERKSFDEDLRISVPTRVLTFANSHIESLEAEISRLNARLVEAQALSAVYSAPTKATIATFNHPVANTKIGIQ